MKALIAIVLLFAALISLPEYSCAKIKQNYPKHWFEKVEKADAPKWEILPQEAKKGEVILSKRNELGLLSNFAHTPFTFENQTYQSVEGFWQMMKYPENKKDLRFVKMKELPKRKDVSQMIGFKAKRAGSKASKVMESLKINWVSYNGKKLPYRVSDKGDHYKLIRAAMRAKLEQNPEVKDVLLKTGNLVLKPDHKQKPNSPPAWQYHKIWMELRAEIQKKKPSAL